MVVLVVEAAVGALIGVAVPFAVWVLWRFAARISARRAERLEQKNLAVVANTFVDGVVLGVKATIAQTHAASDEGMALVVADTLKAIGLWDGAVVGMVSGRLPTRPRLAKVRDMRVLSSQGTGLQITWRIDVNATEEGVSQ